MFFSLRDCPRGLGRTGLETSSTGGRLLTIHGPGNQLVPASQREILQTAGGKVGARCEVVIVPDAPHSFDLQPEPRDSRPLVPGFRRVPTAAMCGGDFSALVNAQDQRITLRDPLNVGITNNLL
jgi:dienelactone hydrolase